MHNTALNALWERAEIFNKMEETIAQLDVEEAKIITVYAENLLKTRPQRRPESCSESGQVSAGTGVSPNAETASVSETNCEFCAAGNPRLKDKYGYYHEFDAGGKFTGEKICEAAYAQN